MSYNHLEFIRDQAKVKSEVIEAISKDINDISEIMEDLSRIIQDQGSLVESIEEHVEKTTKEVQDGRKELNRAEHLKTAKYPAVAALAGGLALGAPLGFVAGSAIVGIFGAVGGAFAGLQSGRIFSNKLRSNS